MTIESRLILMGIIDGAKRFIILVSYTMAVL